VARRPRLYACLEHDPTFIGGTIRGFEEPIGDSGILLAVGAIIFVGVIFYR
jgi:hypothetical protein